MPGSAGVTVVTNARVYYSTRAAAGASSPRPSLRPLNFRRGTVMAKLGRIAPRECGTVFRCHCEEQSDEAIPSYFFCWCMDCFASLAMTVRKKAPATAGAFQINPPPWLHDAER